MDLNYLDLLIHLATELKKEKIKRIEAERKIESDFPRFCLRTLYPDPNAHV